MNRRIMVIGGGAGIGVARLLLEATAMAAQSRVVVIDGQDNAEQVLVRDDDGTTRVDKLNTDELQLLVAVRGQPTFTQQLVLHARDFICAPEWAGPDGQWESRDERRAHWQQTKFGNNRKLQSMQAKARRR